MVPLSEVTIARCEHNYDGTATGLAPQPVAAPVKSLRTPAPVPSHRAGYNGSRSGATSTSNGRTTVASDGASTIADSAPGTAHSVGSSSDSSDDEMSVDSSVVPQQQQRGKSAPTPGTDRKKQPSLVSSAAAAPKSRARPTAAPAAAEPKGTSGNSSACGASDSGCYRVAGRSNVRAPVLDVAKDARRGETKAAAALPLMKEHWRNMKRLYGWKCIYYRASDNVEVYTVPLRDLTPVRDLVEVRPLV